MLLGIEGDGMNEHWSGEAAAEEPRSADIDFTGTWREFLPIALTNLLLSLVTLGIYRFWAKARERRYLWSRTRVLDDTLEWTGTGKEMLVGFLMVMAILLPALLVLNLGVEAMILRRMFVAAGVTATILYAGLFYLYHVARFRSLRYRLSRTYWRGIRGGSDSPGWDYGWSGAWKTAAGWAVFGLLVPWSMTQLWNERWSKMSFGPFPFEARAHESGLMKRWLLVYLVPVVGFILLVAGGITAAFVGPGQGDAQGQPGAGLMLAIFGVVAFIYIGFLLASLSFYALFYRHVAAATTISDVRLAFTARTRDWLKLILGHIGLVIVTLGVGLLFIGYRNWSFIVRHIEASGSIDFDRLTQSETRAPDDAEGLADAFDFGAV
jgi:uncharacterized membrane protein YjgN (DUF898 family)